MLLSLTPKDPRRYIYSGGGFGEQNVVESQNVRDRARPRAYARAVRNRNGTFDRNQSFNPSNVGYNVLSDSNSVSRTVFAMRISVLSSGAMPSRLAPLKRRIVASRAYGSAPEESGSGLLPATVADEAPEVGAQLREWLASPFDFAAFGPRLTVGALLSAPDKISSLQTEIEKARDIINSPAPPEDKSKLLAAQIEGYDSHFFSISLTGDVSVTRRAFRRDHDSRFKVMIW